VALNENLDVNRLDDTVRRAFLGRPEKILLKPSLRFYRWQNQPKLSGPIISPWWSFFDSRTLPSGRVADGYRVIEERAHRLGTSHRKLARNRAAISAEFRNQMTHLIVMQLTVEAWALAGQASGQPKFANETIGKEPDLQHVTLIGGAHQLWIPNLTPLCLHQLPAQA